MLQGSAVRKGAGVCARACVRLGTVFAPALAAKIDKIPEPAPTSITTAPCRNGLGRKLAAYYKYAQRRSQRSARHTVGAAVVA